MTRKLVIVRFLCITLESECTQIFPELFSIFGWTAANLAAVQTLLCLSELHHSQWRRGCPSLVQVHMEVERVDIAAHLVREASERRPIRQVQMHMYLPAM